ncbi:hypothetical protein [Methylobacterium aerolatum]|uniref:Uncharacterized protein n=1 Tax=Methylobacterium aerolatum TaxID=418708 RepID=A0ABU0I3L0_9HYPH|nr:hypothetical protein [Methylobacterium aerolatum]MDQ0449194.1 hypothetical protein [Methylobacterium aerolatum]GJD35381.1 hypothetical protein FMGBMHLM_2291 [Methylobacterium aerolatum]
MKVISATLVGLTLLGSVAPALAQGYGRDYGYDQGYDRGDYGRRDRYDYDRRSRDDDYRDRGDYGRRSRGEPGDYAFDEQEYLRCNPDVRKAVVNGQVKSGLFHYRKVGRAEGRRLSC